VAHGKRRFTGVNEKMNKGTPEGTEEEISFVKSLNSNKDNSFWNVLIKNKDKSSIFAVRVISKKFGKINQCKILPKADVFLIESNEIYRDYLEKKDYLLTEKDLEKIKFRYLMKSGISIKRPDSKRYQILKMAPKTFNKIFGNYELGAGASIYCTKEAELEKNNYILKGWHTSEKKILDFFKEKNLDLESCKRIKKKSNNIIEKEICDKKKISDFVFKGIGNFEDPFFATWFYEKGLLKEATKIPFVITTGSGRSRGDFTLVVKPK
jgi:hypothetical protein